MGEVYIYLYSGEMRVAWVDQLMCMTKHTIEDSGCFRNYVWRGSTLLIFDSVLFVRVGKEAPSTTCAAQNAHHEKLRKLRLTSCIR